MVATEIKYLAGREEQKQLKRDNFNNNIQLFYYKATIVVLLAVLVTVSGILVWQLLNSKHDCGKRYNKKRCYMVRKKQLPSILFTEVKNILNDVRERLKEKVDKNNLISISSSAFYKTQTVWKADFGVVDKSSFPQQIPNEHTLYRSGSLVKLLTTVIAFKLLQDGKINCMDDPFRKYAPQFSVKNPFNNDAITIRQLLSHTSGLPREVPCGPSFSSQRETICPVNTTYVYQQNIELKFPPGSAVGYSNLGYALLAHGLFEQFGDGYSSWKKWISDQLLSPLRLHNTVLDDHRFDANIAVNYKGNGLVTPKLDWGWSSPSLQMSTSTRDLTKLMNALIGTKSSLLRKNIIQEMFKPVFVFPDSHTIFSSGWQVHNHDSLQVISKGGAVPGSSAAIFAIPEVNFGFILLATGQEIAPMLAEDISKKISKAFVSSSIRSGLQVTPPKRPFLYTGDYSLINKWSDEVHATIFYEPFTRRLKFQQAPGYPKIVYLSFITSNMLQIIYPRGLSCQTYALGQDKELLNFSHPDSTGYWQQFTLGSFLFRRGS